MRRTLTLVLAVGLVLMTIPAAGAQLGDDNTSVELPEPVNQSASVDVDVNDDGSTTITLATTGEMSNESVTVGTPSPTDVVNDVGDLVISLCNTVVGLLGPFRCA